MALRRTWSILGTVCIDSDGASSNRPWTNHKDCCSNKSNKSGHFKQATYFTAEMTFLKKGKVRNNPRTYSVSAALLQQVVGTVACSFLYSHIVLRNQLFLFKMLQPHKIASAKVCFSLVSMMKQAPPTHSGSSCHCEYETAAAVLCAHS